MLRRKYRMACGGYFAEMCAHFRCINAPTIGCGDFGASLRRAGVRQFCAGLWRMHETVCTFSSQRGVSQITTKGAEVSYPLPLCRYPLVEPCFENFTDGAQVLCCQFANPFGFSRLILIARGEMLCSPLLDISRHAHVADFAATWIFEGIDKPDRLRLHDGPRICWRLYMR